MTCHQLMKQTWLSQTPRNSFDSGIARYFDLTAKYHARQLRLNKHMSMWMAGGQASQSQEED